jgi:hypothetical protein
LAAQARNVRALDATGTGAATIGTLDGAGAATAGAATGATVDAAGALDEGALDAGAVIRPIMSAETGITPVLVTNTPAPAPLNAAASAISFATLAVSRLLSSMPPSELGAGYVANFGANHFAKTPVRGS